MVKIKVLAFIGARGGSKRLPKKNLQKIGKKTLIEVTIEQALQSKLIDKIVFTSEDKVMIENASQYGDRIGIHYRNPELSKDDVDIDEVVKDVSNNYPDYDTIVILQVDHPFKTPEMIDKCINAFKDNSVQDVITYKNNKRTGSIRVISRDALFSGLPTGHIYLIEDHPNFIDIHTSEDLEKANEIIPNCFICGSSNAGRFKGEKNLWKCNACDVVFQYPQNDFEYSTYSNSRDAGRKKRIEQYKLDIKEIMRYKKSGSFLDVGCGDGTFLTYLPNTFEKDGIDVRGKYRVGDFPSYKFNEKYEVVHMRGTLEHLKQPRFYIEKAYNILKADGLLIISHLPNIDNYPKMKGLIKPDEHLFYFNPGSITKLLEDNGFKILDILFPFYDTPYQYDYGAHFMNVMSIYARRR